jgi:CMP-N,N'-diacetyllegionaminic acid synthase
MNKKKIIAIIPARGGSKGIPKKNIALVAGKPLIQYTIESAKQSKKIDKLVVSTDSEEIATIARNLGVEVIKRPTEFARDDSSTMDVINHVLEVVEEKFDMLAILEPTSPLRKEEDIDNAISLLLKEYETADAVISLGEIALENPFLSKIIKNKFLTPLIKTENKVYQRQQLQKTYFPYGVIYLSKINTLLETDTFYQEKTIPYFIERWQNYEIDDAYDLIVVERIIQYRGEE